MTVGELMDALARFDPATHVLIDQNNGVQTEIEAVAMGEFRVDGAFPLLIVCPAPEGGDDYEGPFKPGERVLHTPTGQWAIVEDSYDNGDATIRFEGQDALVVRRTGDLIPEADVVPDFGEEGDEEPDVDDDFPMALEYNDDDPRDDEVARREAEMEREVSGG